MQSPAQKKSKARGGTLNQQDSTRTVLVLNVITCTFNLSSFCAAQFMSDLAETNCVLLWNDRHNRKHIAYTTLLFLAFLIANEST